MPGNCKGSILDRTLGTWNRNKQDTTENTNCSLQNSFKLGVQFLVWMLKPVTVCQNSLPQMQH